MTGGIIFFNRRSGWGSETLPERVEEADTIAAFKRSWIQPLNGNNLLGYGERTEVGVAGLPLHGGDVDWMSRTVYFCVIVTLTTSCKSLDSKYFESVFRSG